MAIYRFSVKVISRSSGRSSVAAAAYRSAEKITDHRQGLEHNYSQRGGVLHTEILLPENAPDWMNNRSDLWNAVEASENRKDARLSREVLVSLPHELTSEGRRDLVASFVQEQFVDRGMVADIAHHAPGDEGDERNHHAHIMLTTRSIEGDGFGGKDRTWNAKELLEEWREAWAEHVNYALEREGFAVTVDHRSLRDRHAEQVALQEAALERGDIAAAQEHAIEALSLDRDPLPHIGPHAWAMERRGISTAVGAAVRDVMERAEQIREAVENLRQAFLDFAERSGLAEVFDRIRGGREAVPGVGQRLQAARNLSGEELEQASFDAVKAAAEDLERIEREEAAERAERERLAEIEAERVRTLEAERARSRDNDYGWSL